MFEQLGPTVHTLICPIPLLLLLFLLQTNLPTSLCAVVYMALESAASSFVHFLGGNKLSFLRSLLLTLTCAILHHPLLEPFCKDHINFNYTATFDIKKFFKNIKKFLKDTF